MKTITPQELSKQLSEGKPLCIVDVRSSLEYRLGHIPGALNIPLPSLGDRVPECPSGARLVFVCQSGARSAMACEKAKSAHPGAFNLTGGTGSWMAAGLPVERAPSKPLSLDRQTHLVAGLIIAAAVILGTKTAPGWFYLAALPGFGLLLHAMTGICPMTEILKRMPFNKGLSCPS